MATVVFDLDSTLLTCESLEEILSGKLSEEPLKAQLREITDLGMQGALTFASSLEKRLSMACVSKKDLVNFALNAEKYFTPGMEALIGDLKAFKTDVWVVSGAPIELARPIAERLGVEKSHVLAIELSWDPEGNYMGIDFSKPINRSKWEGAESVASSWIPPVIGVGDGMTDYALFEHGAVQHFIAFTGNARRSVILRPEVVQADNVKDLERFLKMYMIPASS